MERAFLVYTLESTIHIDIRRDALDFRHLLRHPVSSKSLLGSVGSASVCAARLAGQVLMECDIPGYRRSIPAHCTGQHT